MAQELIKENASSRLPLPAWSLAGALVLSALALAAVSLAHSALPPPQPRDGPPEQFSAEIAHEHLVNLTSIGPRVAGSYENEVVSVAMLVAAVRAIERAASPHHRIELDVHAADGAFSLTFLDGLNNVYRGVQSVVVRVSAAGAEARPGTRPATRPATGRNALLLNCHFDTVPDSPGASDDGAGCAVLLETLRALTAARRALRHPAIFLFNGAEENIMQASHAFITTHKWARSVRAFINLEAMGAGGREVLFQAGPGDPWLLDAYALVPRPFASSLAQELFQSGLIPADTDFRIFRDFGNLSGVDLAWSSNGYVYHTRLDTSARVPPAALQRTGDNVLALVRGLTAGSRLEEAGAGAGAGDAGVGEGPPVYFDVLGVGVVSARAPAALGAAALAAALVLLDVHLAAGDARYYLVVRRGAWWRAVGAAAGCGAAGAAAGAAAAAAHALALHAAGARMLFYARPWLLAPLYALPALCISWLTSVRLWGAWCARGGVGAGAGGVGRGWWGARAWHAAGAVGAALATLGCAARGLRSGFLPLLWALPPALASLLAARLPPASRARPALWAAGYALPALQTTYLALPSLAMFVPVMGRAGDGPLPADVAMALIVSALALAACGWMLPFLVATRRPHRVVYAVLGACAVVGAGAVVVSRVVGPRAAYSADAPKRLMVFHTRRTQHARPAAYAPDADDDHDHNHTVDHFYWMPDLDSNPPHSLAPYMPELGSARAVTSEECARWVYCGVPYYLPVLGLIARSHMAPAPAASPPLVRVRVSLATRPLNLTTQLVELQVAGSAHVVVACAAAAGARVAWTSLVARPLRGTGPRWRGRDTYFFALHDARAQRGWNLQIHLQHSFGAGAPERWMDVSVAGHAQFGSRRLAAAHARLLAAAPAWLAATGWGVDLHLYTL